MEQRRRHRHSMTCRETGKLGYKNRALAREARKWSRLLNGEKTSEWSVYRCQYCNYWHIGHNYNYREHHPREDDS